MSFGEKLQYLRKSKGLSQEQLAGQMTVSRQAVSKWELDSAMPDTENIVQISMLFGVTTDYLLYDNIEVELVHLDKKLNNSESNNELETSEILEKHTHKDSGFPKNYKKYISQGLFFLFKVLKFLIQISLIVSAANIMAFAIAMLTKPYYLPFFSMIATAISMVVVVFMSMKRR